MPMRFRERSRDRIVGCPVSAPRRMYAPSSPMPHPERSSDRSMHGGVSSMRDTWHAATSYIVMGEKGEGGRRGREGEGLLQRSDL